MGGPTPFADSPFDSSGGMGQTPAPAPPGGMQPTSHGVDPAGVSGTTGTRLKNDASAYDQTLSQLRGTNDLQLKAQLRDKLARDVFSTLKTAGHEVKWQGDQLLVDGRPYVVGGDDGGPNTTPAAEDPAHVPYEDGGITGGLDTLYGDPAPGLQPSADPAAPDALAPPSWLNDTSTVNLPGWDPSRTDNDPKMELGRFAASKGGILTGDDIRAFVAADPRWEIDPNSSRDDPHIRVKQNELDKWKPGVSMWQDVIADSGPGGANRAQFSNADGGPSPVPGANDLARPTTISGPSAQGAAGVQTQSGTVPVTSPTPTPQAAPAAPAFTPTPAAGPTFGSGGTAGLAAPSSGGIVPDGSAGPDPLTAMGGGELYGPPGAQGWRPKSQPTAQATAPGGATAAGAFTPAPGTTYTPGEITDDDIPNYSYEDLAHAGDAGASDDATEALLLKLLQNPESMDPHTVDMMKARSKDELGEMQLLDDQNLGFQGEQLGVSDSPWLQSERNSGRRARDIALVKSNRDIEVGAAATNAADKRSALAAGTAYAGNKGSRNLAGAQLAADTTLRQASLRGDRMALRESIKQKAAELGQSEQKIMYDYTLGLMDDLTRRYGIDVGAAIDREKLKQARTEWLEELSFKLAQLAQQDAQFGAGYGLDYVKTQHDIDEDMDARRRKDQIPVGSGN